ncbi:hypothetical protein LGM43_23865 [Burkholderia seminalis]|uniref:hypothetical protein n=1 Tax=Burkholderia seminalis TaxID=488731 RepID=UPI001CF3B5A4|nr:hypothetical protein [Burkholderia seminalis]MCA7953309.1 hypothetical protein [Burkholderia seminalis]
MKKIGLCSKHLVLTCILLCALTYIQFRPLLIGLSAIAATLVIAFWIATLLRRQHKRSRMHLYFITLVICGLWSSFLFANFKYYLIDLALIKIHAPAYENCKNNGAVTDSKFSLSVCSVNNEWWRFGFTRAVVYDSSNQILREPKNRSKEWRDAALSLNRQVPFGIVGFEARKLSQNYYAVTFYDALEENVTLK